MIIYILLNSHLDKTNEDMLNEEYTTILEGNKVMTGCLLYDLYDKRNFSADKQTINVK